MVSKAGNLAVQSRVRFQMRLLIGRHGAESSTSYVPIAVATHGSDGIEAMAMFKGKALVQF